MSNIGQLLKGQILVGTGSQNVPVGPGTDGNVLTADSTQPSGLSYQPAGGTPTDDLSIGALVYFATNNGDAYLSPKYLKCNGQVVSQATYPTLYARVGLINAPGTQWTTNTTGVTGFTFNAVIYGGSQFVLGANTGVLYTSTDGVTLAFRTTGQSNNINSLVYGNSLYVGSGAGGAQGYAITSTDGITWTNRVTGLSSATITGLAYGASLYIGTGNYNGTIPAGMTSTDAITWKTRTPYMGIATQGTPGILGVDAYFGQAPGIVYFSPDGLTYQASQPTTSTVSSTSVGFGNGLFLVGQSGGNLATSTNGLTWTAQTSGTTTSISALGYGNGLYLLGAGTYLATSTDAVTWASRTWGGGGSITVLAYGNSTYVGGNSQGQICTSTDGTSWTLRTSGTSSSITSLIYDGTKFVMTGNGGFIGSSTDGITWGINASATIQGQNKILYDGTQYVTVGLSGTIQTTGNVTTGWTLRTSGTTSTLTNLSKIGSVFYAGGNGFNLTSTDAITWTQQGYGLTAQISSIVYGGGKFVLGSTLGKYATSTDGVTFTPATLAGTSGTIASLQYLNGIYVFGMSFGAVITSTDLVTFTSHSVPDTSSSVTGVTYANSLYVAQTNLNIATSTDLVTWVNRFTTTSTINGIAAGSTRFLAVGQKAVYYALEDYPYNSATSFQLPTDNNLLIVQELPSNFARGLYIKAL